jgi:hypothetical protein
MNANHRGVENGLSPLRTTLLELVQSLTHEDRMPDEVVQLAHESIDADRVVLIGNFRGGLGVAAQVRAVFRAPTRRRKPAMTEQAGPSRIDGPSERQRE